MNRRQHLRQIARQSLIARPPGKPPLRPLAALCATLHAWAETAGSRLLLALDQDTGLLSEDWKWGAAVAAAIATGSHGLIKAVLRDAEGRITHQTRDLARREMVVALMAQEPALPMAADREPQPCARVDTASEATTAPTQDRDAPAVALFALAGAVAWVGRVDLQPRLDAARAAGVSDEAIGSILGIAHALAVVATILNGVMGQKVSHDQEHLLAS